MRNHQIGMIFNCMDRRLDHELIAWQLRQKFGLRPQAEGEWTSAKYSYLLSSPGGNLPFYLPLSLEILALNSQKNGESLEFTHAFFSTHTDCAAQAARLNLTPKEGAKWFIAFYKHKQAKYPEQLIGRPKIYYLKIETTYSWVEDLVEAPNALWDQVPAYSGSRDELKNIGDLLKL